jgi:hypothetical protein
MGFDWKKAIGVATDIGGAAGIPGLAQADAIKDAVLASKAKVDEKAALLAQIEELKAAQAQAVKPVPKGLLEGKRTQYALIGVAVMFAVQAYGLPQETADQLMQWVSILFSGAIAAETLRPSTK